MQKPKLIPHFQMMHGWVLVLGLLLTSCSPSLRWVADSSVNSPSCSPNRLPTWDDFSKRDTAVETPAAQTAIRFLLQESPPYFIAHFDPDFSWVKSTIVKPDRPAKWIASEQLLAHEQVHFLISCLLVREANSSLRPGDDPRKMLELLKSVAQRINVQYDQDTNHGVDIDAQAKWESDVQEQFEEVSLKVKE